MGTRVGPDIEQARSVLRAVVDPEIPQLTIDDLGLLRDVTVDGAWVEVTITPTYTGCPAMRQIEEDIKSVLLEAGFQRVEVITTYSPPWTTEWITEEGHRKLAEAGIAPPTPREDVLCPNCREGSPRMVTLFGSTACKALMVCSSCGEPFDYFKEF